MGGLAGAIGIAIFEGRAQLRSSFEVQKAARIGSTASLPADSASTRSCSSSIVSSDIPFIPRASGARTHYVPVLYGNIVMLC